MSGNFFMSDAGAGVADGGTDAGGMAENMNLGAGNDGAGAGGDWRESVPETYRDAPWLQKYDSPDAFYKGMDEAQKMLGQRPQGLLPLGDDATDTQRAEFASRLRDLQGIPATEQDYAAALKLPEARDGDRLNQFVNMMHGQGVAPAQAQAIINQFGDWQKEMDAQAEERLQSAQTELQKEWGGDFEYNLNVAERFLSELPDEAVELIRQSGANNNPVIVRAFHSLAQKFLAEDDFKDVNAGRSGVTLEQLHEMQRDPRYHDPSRRDPAFVKRIEEGFQLLYPDQK